MTRDYIGLRKTYRNNIVTTRGVDKDRNEDFQVLNRVTRAIAASDARVSDTGTYIAFTFHLALRLT